MGRIVRSTTLGIGARIAEHAVGLTIAGLFMAPIAWTMLSSLKPAQEARQPPLPPWPTTGITTENYATLSNFGDGLWQSLGNSTFVAFATVALTVLVSLLAGYGFSRFAFPLKGLCFLLILATIMIPFQSILTPIFLILTGSACRTP